MNIFFNLTRIIEKTEVQKRLDTGERFYPINIKNCIDIGWNDDLSKLFLRID